MENKKDRWSTLFFSI